MTSSDLLEKIDLLLPALADDKYLMQVLKSLSGSSYDIAGTVSSYLGMGSPPELQNYNERIKRELSEIVEKNFKDIDPFKLAGETKSLEERLRVFGSALKGGTEFNRVYSDAIDKFQEEYKKFNRDMRLPETVVMLHAAANLYSSLISHRAMLIMVRDNLRDAEPTTEGKSRLTIVIESEMTFTAFATKASAIDDAYSTVARLLKVDLLSQPLSIVKVESGSAVYDLLGNPGVIAVLSNVTTATVAYLFGKFSRENKIAAVPRSVEAAEKVLGLVERLSENGYDMSQAEENVKNAVVQIAKDMNDLLDGVPVVRINGERHSVATALEQRFLEAQRQKLLGHTQELQKTNEDEKTST